MRLHETRRARVRVDRRIRRALRAGLATAVLGVVVAGVGLTAVPAGAAVAAPTVRVVGGNRQVTVGWQAVAGASGYTVRLSASSSMSSPRVSRTTGSSKAFTSLTNGRTYYARVVPEVGGVPATASQSAVKPVTPHSGDPIPIDNANVKVTSAGPNQIRVAWSGGGRATKVGVIAGSDVNMTTRKFTNGWKAATTRSILLTVPDGHRPVLGTGSGNPVFVKIVQSNLTDPNPAMGLRYSDALDYRLTMPGKYAFAGRPTTTAAAGMSRISVGEFNVQSVGASERFSTANQWAARKSRVAATITKYAPDLLLTAELASNLASNTDCQNTSTTFPCKPYSQYRTLARLLPSYKLATNDAYEKVILKMRAEPDWKGRITAGAHIFYNGEKLELLGHGFLSPVFDLKVPGWTPSLGDRWISWAKFEVVSTSGSAAPTRFYAVAAHFPVGESSAMIDLRLAEAQRLVARLNSFTGNLPVVLAGDLNADTARAPRAGATEFIKDGYFDVAATTAATGRNYSTSRGSGTQDGADPGYPRTATRMPYVTSRIDYILVKRSPYTFGYENVISLVGTGQTLDNSTYNGSDHNLQIAQVGIANPVP